MSRWRRIVLATLLAATVPPLAAAQEMLRYFDLKSDEFTKADMTRIEVEAVLAAANPARPADLSARRLNGLDLSGLDFRGAKLQATRLNGANLAGANLDGATLDQAWALDADLTGATLRGASLFATQLIGAKLDGADLSDARITGATSTTIVPGNRVGLVPYNTFSLWNKYQFNSVWAAGVGVFRYTNFFASSDDTVLLPEFTRVDAAIYFRLNEMWRAQLNIENIFDQRYIATADGNNNITPGSPRAFRLSATANF